MADPLREIMRAMGGSTYELRMATKYRITTLTAFMAFSEMRPEDIVQNSVTSDVADTRFFSFVTGVFAIGVSVPEPADDLRSIGQQDADG